MNNKTSNILVPLLLLGLVDNIQNGWVSAEITSRDDTNEHEVVTIELPVDIFPCEIGEGDMFYFTYVENVTEIRCGEPPQ